MKPARFSGSSRPELSDEPLHSMNLQPDFDLSARNTMGLASTAAFGGLVASADAIPAMVEAARGRNLPLHVLGGGSNVILQDHVPAVVAVMDIRHRAVGQGDAGATLVEVGAGETWHDIV
ncbi:FAD-binding protein, partial [Salmonella enterica subsp. enterica]|nr:FAD-binding protein [Salmonella enterica subsp. enterica serovar Enteritidis]